MISIDDVRAGLAGCVTMGQPILGYLSQARTDIELEIQMLLRVCEGTDRADAAEAAALLQKALQLVVEAMQTLGASQSAIEDVAARL